MKKHWNNPASLESLPGSFVDAEVGAGAHGRLSEEDQPAGRPLCREDQNQLPPLWLERQRHPLNVRTQTERTSHSATLLFFESVHFLLSYILLSNHTGDDKNQMQSTSRQPR